MSFAIHEEAYTLSSSPRHCCTLATMHMCLVQHACAMSSRTLTELLITHACPIACLQSFILTSVLQIACCVIIAHGTQISWVEPTSVTNKPHDHLVKR